MVHPLADVVPVGIVLHIAISPCALREIHCTAAVALHVVADELHALDGQGMRNW